MLVTGRTSFSTEQLMAIRRSDRDLPQTDFGLKDQSSESVLGRVQRGNYKPTESDLEELRQLAETGNRADRRAAARALKKHGVVPPEPSPKAPVVNVIEPTVSEVAVQQKPPVPRPQRVEAPAKPAQPHAAAPKSAGPQPEPGRKAVVKKAAAGKTTPVKTATKKAAAKAAPAKKAGAKKAAPKKAAGKKAVAKKTPAKKTPAKKAGTKKAPTKKTTRRR
jgi:hypothetical protein